MLSDVDHSQAQEVSAGQKVEINGSIKELQSYNQDELFVDPAVRLAVVIEDVSLTSVKLERGQISIVDDYKNVVITLKNPVCGMLSDRCYTYNLVVYGIGKVIYTEEDWDTGEITRTETTNISENKVRDLVAEFDKANYFSWKDDYSDYDVSDAPSATSSITTGMMRKSIFHYYGDRDAPGELSDLESMIDAIYSPSASTPTVSP